MGQVLTFFSHSILLLKCTTENNLRNYSLDTVRLPNQLEAYPPDADNMNHVHLIAFYYFGASLEPLHKTKEGEAIFETWIKLSNAKRWLDTFFDETKHISMSHAKDAAKELYAHIDKILNRISIDGIIPDKDKEPISSYEAIWLVEFVKRFEQEFRFASRDLNIFSVADIGTHSTTKLLQDAHLNLSVGIRARLSDEVINDIKAAGRCLALNIPTAAGFHILRAVEPLILQYRNKLAGTSNPLRSRNWGTYTRDIRSHAGDEKVIGAIDHIRQFYRNPIMHPEETLTLDYATSLFNACLSVIVQLDAAIEGK